MIRSMVDGLEEKLKADGNDLDGWLRLIRARVVLGDTDKAKLAYDTAKAQFKDNPQAIAALDGLAKEMNIQ
jgi:cytochrome c-type biogenesis protein CcmH